MQNSKIKIMEVCGTHTSVIVRGGVRASLPPEINLVSGPGCPVCVTGEGYIDRLIELGEEGRVIVTFGDMIKVPGSGGSLGDFKARGGDVRMVYSPFDVIKMAKDSDREFIFAAVGFETIAPIYAMLTRRLCEEGIENVKLLLALKTIAPALKILARDVDGFIAPGHVAAIMGSKHFEDLAGELSRPFSIAGFTADAVSLSVKNLAQMVKNGEKRCENLYASMVSHEGNEKAKSLMDNVFKSGDAVWRGIGNIENSGLYFKDEYKKYDGGSENIKEIEKSTPCRCGEVLSGKITPEECPLFGKACTPMSPNGPCMVSNEGACGIWYQCGKM